MSFHAFVFVFVLVRMFVCVCAGARSTVYIALHFVIAVEEASVPQRRRQRPILAIAIGLCWMCVEINERDMYRTGAK